MITLYIKTHRQTGLKYFGKTTEDDPITYKGSGKHWLRHLIKYGYECDTEIYLQSEDQEYVTQEALRFSRVYDIVNSDLWANLREENGLDGWTKGIKRPENSTRKLGKKRPPRSIEWCENLSKAKKGIPKFPFSEEHKTNLSKSKAKTWIVINPIGREYIVSNLSEFCSTNNLSNKRMSELANKTINHYKGWFCKKVNQ